MNKNSLYVVFALALAVTGATFFVSKSGAATACSTQLNVGGQNPAVPGGPIEDKTVRTATHGFPLWYYQEPLPEGCLSANGAGATGSFSVGHLGDDFLIWLIVSLVLFIGLAWGRSLRDRPMLGYGKEPRNG